MLLPTCSVLVSTNSISGFYYTHYDHQAVFHLSLLLSSACSCENFGILNEITFVVNWPFIKKKNKKKMNRLDQLATVKNKCVRVCKSEPKLQAVNLQQENTLMCHDREIASIKKYNYLQLNLF